MNISKKFLYFRYDQLFEETTALRNIAWSSEEEVKDLRSLGERLAEELRKSGVETLEKEKTQQENEERMMNYLKEITNLNVQYEDLKNETEDSKRNEELYKEKLDDANKTIEELQKNMKELEETKIVDLNKQIETLNQDNQKAVQKLLAEAEEQKIKDLKEYEDKLEETKKKYEVRYER